MTYEQLKKAVMEFFGDTSRTAGQTKSGLFGISDFAITLAESIDAKPEE